MRLNLFQRKRGVVLATMIELLELEDLTRDVSDEEYALIAKAITKWSSLYSELLGVFAQVSGLQLPLAGMVVGTMDMRGLYTRVLAIIAFRAGLNRKVKTKTMNARIAELQVRRNELAHGDLLGKRVSTGELLFLLNDYVPREDGDTVTRVAAYSPERLQWVCDSIDRLGSLLGSFPSIYNDDPEKPN